MQPGSTMAAAVTRSVMPALDAQMPIAGLHVAHLRPLG